MFQEDYVTYQGFQVKIEKLYYKNTSSVLILRKTKKLSS